MPRLLTAGLLGELEARWRDQGAPVVDAAVSGLSEEEMDRVTGRVGLCVPAEARTWWGWHNGVEPGTRAALDRQVTASGWQMLSLTESVEYAVSRVGELAIQFGPDALRDFWRVEWLPLATNYHGGVIAVDGRAPRSAVESPVFYTEPQVGTTMADARTATLGDLVEAWIEAFDAGVYRFDAESHRWVYDYERLAPDADGFVV